MVDSSLTREQLEERLLALHHASLELVQDISLDSLLKRIALLACQQAGARFAAVGVLGSNGELEQFIPVGMSEQEVALMASPPRGLGLIGELSHSRTAIRLADISRDERAVGFPLHHPPMVSFLGVPIRQGERQFGQIYLTDKIGAAEFNDSDQRLIEMLASYAAVAISNARLYKELIRRDRILTRRNENQSLLNELATTLATSSDIDEILDKALTQVMDYLQLDVGEVFLMQEDGQTLQLAMHCGSLLTTLWTRTQFLLDDGVIGVTARGDQPNLLSLPSDDERHLSQAVLEAGVRQIACLPLSGRGGIIGVLCVASCHPRPLDELEMQFLSTITSLVGTAIENVRLSLQGTRLAILEERERIGMDLHDGIIQSIYAVGLTLEHARLLLGEDPAGSRQRIEQAVSDLNRTIRDIRAYILDLRPRQLHDESLRAAITRLTAEFRANTLLNINVQLPQEELNMQKPGAIALFHICQEALANITKHSRARNIEVLLWKTPERVLLEIHDDGSGFDPGKTKLNIGHGLSNMRTRAVNVGGELDISSEPGAGTTIFAWVPYVPIK